MTRLLLTRPKDDSAGLSRALDAMGFKSIAAPLLQIENIAGPNIVTDGLQGFLVTSANGVRALAERTDERDLPVFAVGDATARAALECGFGTITSAAGDVGDLVTLVAHACDPAAGAFFHAAGTVTAGDLTGQLGERGFQVKREQLYHAIAVGELPKDAAAALASGAIDGVVIYSPRTAESFVARVNEAGLIATLADVTLFALSDNVRNAAGLVWDETIVASSPTQESLLNAIRTCYY